jgi:hypothetical protein
MDIAAATKIFDALRPKSEGDPVNVHVVPYEKVPEPDFEAMRKLIAGIDEQDERKPETRTVPENK